MLGMLRRGGRGMLKRRRGAKKGRTGILRISVMIVTKPWSYEQSEGDSASSCTRSFSPISFLFHCFVPQELGFPIVLTCCKARDSSKGITGRQNKLRNFISAIYRRIILFNFLNSGLTYLHIHLLTSLSNVSTELISHFDFPCGELCSLCSVFNSHRPIPLPGSYTMSNLRRRPSILT